MIVRISIHHSPISGYSYEVQSEGGTLYGDEQVSSFMNCLAAAIEGLDDEVTAAELAFQGVVSGTYPLQVLATRPAEVAQHAVNTFDAVLEVERGHLSSPGNQSDVDG